MHEEEKIQYLEYKCFALVDCSSLKRVKITFSKKRKSRYALRVVNGDTLEVLLPVRYDAEAVLVFVQKHLRYIRNRLREAPVLNFGVGQTVWLFAKRYTVTEADGVFYLMGECAEKIACGESVIVYIQRALAQDGFSFLNGYTRTMAGVCALKYARTGLTKNKSYWACCRHKAGGDEICYRIYACLLPEPLLRYLAVHELCHTKEHNHSARFWALVKKYLPEYETLRKALKGISPEAYNGVFRLEK